MLKRRNWAFVDHKVVVWWRVPTETMLVYAKNCADWSSCFKWTRTIKCSEFVFPGHPVYMYSTIKHNCLIAVTSAWCTVLHQSSDSIPRSVGRSPLFFGAHCHKSDLNHLRTKRLIIQKFFTETRRNINNSREGGLEPNRTVNEVDLCVPSAVSTDGRRQSCSVVSRVLLVPLSPTLTGQRSFLCGPIYTLNHKKRDILFLTITLANLDRFL